jgi:hypothetical protein
MLSADRINSTKLLIAQLSASTAAGTYTSSRRIGRGVFAAD